MPLDREELEDELEELEELEDAELEDELEEPAVVIGRLIERMDRELSRMRKLLREL